MTRARLPPGLPLKKATFGDVAAGAGRGYRCAMITVLLATRNGAAHLAEQLASLEAQSHRDWRLLVSDDGSTDATREIVAGFAAARPGREVRLIDGPRAGATRNFLHLVRAAPPEDWLAYCDQDDIWLPDRLARGLARIGPESGLGDGPAVTASRTIICAEDMTQITPAPLYTREPGFLNALVQACLPGNTTLMNPAAAAVLRQSADAAADAGVVSHDWWTYLLLSGIGARIVRDPATTVLYRQHRGNEMGRNDTPRARIARLVMLGACDYWRWLHRNRRALETCAALLTPQARDQLARFGAAIDAPGPQAARLLARLGVYRQTRAGQAALLLAAAAGRLRG